MEMLLSDIHALLFALKPLEVSGDPSCLEIPIPLFKEVLAFAKIEIVLPPQCRA